MYKDVPEYTRFIGTVTVLYLIFECGFNARLLDVMAQNTAIYYIDSIEWWGRSLSGIAVLLAFWGFYLLPYMYNRYWSAKGQFFMMLLSALVLVPSVYKVEKIFVDCLVSRTTPEEKHDMVTLSLLREQAIAHTMTFDNIPLNTNSPEGKSLLVLLPANAMLIPGISDTIKTALRKALSSKITQDFGGNDKDVYNKTYLPANGKVMFHYTLYKMSVYNLKHHKIWPWTYKNQVLENSGRLLPLNLSLSQYSLASPVAQDIFHNDLKIPFKAIPADLSFSQFDELYQKAYDEANKKINETIDMPIDAYSSGMHGYYRGDYFTKDGVDMMEKGTDAANSVIAPAIALVLSLLGALLHTLKVLNYTLVLRRKSWRKTIVTGTLILLLAATQIPNTLTQSQGYKTLQQHTQHVIFPHIVSGVINIERILYPVNELIRKTALLGFNFGVPDNDDDSE